MKNGSPRSRLPGTSGHIIIGGGGRLGDLALSELIRLGQHALGRQGLVVIEQAPERVDRLHREYGDTIRIVAGDATEDSVLAEAGAGEASGLIASLSHPRDNLFLCLTARQMNSDMRIVARIDGSVTPAKFRRIGADALVDPTDIGGRRLAHAMIQPELAQLADGLIQSTERSPLLLEIEIGKSFSRRKLRDCQLEAQTGCIIVGVRTRRAKHFLYQPPPDTKLKHGGTILALGERAELDHLLKLLGQS
ncbi:MAG: voltage-gated potassium channel [Myxococcota bacterium]|jgi:voltage-gated potassium channel